MSPFQQKNIEQYFDDYKINSTSQKEKLLPEVTSMIHDRNDLVIELEQAEDKYKKDQIKEDITEMDEKIADVFEDFITNND
jgi:tyrosyl-tRNA synthetase